MPVLSRFGAQPGVVEDAREHYREAARRTIGELSPPMARLRLHLDNNVETAEELIAAMLARRSHPGNRVLVALVKLLEKRGPHLTP